MSPSQSIVADTGLNPAAWRLYLLLALFDRRDGSALGDLVQMAREAYEREATEPDAWDLFDRTWGNLTSGQRLAMAKAWFR